MSIWQDAQTNIYFTVAIMQHFTKDSTMIEAIVLVCFINTNCVEIHDDRGPYIEEVQCKARVAEMLQDFISFEETPPVTFIDYKCRPVKEGIST